MASPIPPITIPIGAANLHAAFNWLIDQINNALSDSPAPVMAYGAEPMPTPEQMGTATSQSAPAEEPHSPSTASREREPSSSATRSSR